MKRVRTEQIQMAVSCYLKRRQYVDSDGPLKPGLRLSQTPEEMAASLSGKRGAQDSRAEGRRPAGPAQTPRLPVLHAPLPPQASPGLAGGWGSPGNQHVCHWPQVL